MREKGLPAHPGASWGFLIDKGLLDVVEETLIQPTFILDYPRIFRPLRRPREMIQHTSSASSTSSLGWKWGNAFTELNDPFDQESEFLEMGRLDNADDEEAHPMDEDYLVVILNTGMSAERRLRHGH